MADGLKYSHTENGRVYFDDPAAENAPATNYPPLADYTPPAVNGRKYFSEGELDPGYVPPEKRGPLSNVPDESYLSAIPKSLGTVAKDVVTGTLGAGGDIFNLGAMSTGKIASLLGYPTSAEETLNKAKQYREKTRQEARGGNYLAWTDPFAFLPTSEDVESTLFPRAGSYTPTTSLGRMGQSGLTATAMALLPGGKEDLIPTLGKVAKEAAPAFFGGATAEKVGEETQDPLLAMLAGMGVTLPTSIGLGAAKNWTSPKEQGERLTGSILRTASENPDVAKSAIEKGVVESEAPGHFLPNLPMRSGVMSGDSGQVALDVLLGKDGKFAPPGSYAADLAQAVSGDPALANTIIREGAQGVSARVRPTDIPGSYGIPATAPRQTASTAAHAVYSTFEDQARANMEAAWKDPRIANARLYKNKVIGAIDEYVNGLSDTRKKMLPPDVMDTIENLRFKEGRDIPLGEIQDIRSRVLSYGRSSKDAFTGGQNYDFGKKLGSILSDSSNVVFGDNPRVAPGAPAGSLMGTARGAWQKAVDATREYHQKFNEGFFKKLNEETPGGQLKIAADTMLDKALHQSNGTQVLEQLQKVTNGGINDHVAHYMIADLTDDGKIIKPERVDKWLSQSNNAAIVDKVPGLRQKIDSIRNMSEAEQLANTFASYSDNPKKLLKIFDDNRAAIDRLASPSDKQYFKMLENSAKLWAEDTPGDPIKAAESLKHLASGNTSDLLFAVGSGKVTSALSTMAAAVAAGTFMPESVMRYLPVETAGPFLEGIVGGLAGLPHLKISPRSLVEKMMVGNVPARAMELLQKSRDDLKLRALLMSKPDPKVISSLLNVPGSIAVTNAGSQGVEYGRQGFASGGAVGDYDSEAERLIEETDKARKFLSSQTEAILSKPDDHVVAALNVVKHVI